jgi:hypothetical protein
MSKHLVGNRYGRLRVIYRSNERRHGHVVWHCICDCGNETNVTTGSLTTGVTRSCGCYQREISSITKIGDLNPAKRPEVRKILSEKRRVRKTLDSTRVKLSISHTGLLAGDKHPLYGKHPTKETREKRSKSMKGKLCGDKHPNWKGGISYEPYCPRWTPELRQRIRAFFSYRCLLCGKSTEENEKSLSCHHVEYNKQACCDGETVHFAALCTKCHGKTCHDVNRWEAIIHQIIDEMYEGRSYYTRIEHNIIICLLLETGLQAHKEANLFDF